MEMRKFVVTLHESGEITWNEYIENSKEDVNRICGGAFQEVSSRLETYPCALWSPEVKAAYLNGAAHMMDILRKFL